MVVMLFGYSNLVTKYSWPDDFLGSDSDTSCYCAPQISENLNGLSRAADFLTEVYKQILKKIIKENKYDARSMNNILMVMFF